MSYSHTNKSILLLGTFLYYQLHSGCIWSHGQTKCIVLQRGDKTHAHNSRVWELGANLAFPRTSRYKKADLEITTIVWLFHTLCAHLYQFAAHVYIFNSLAECLARTAVWNPCPHPTGLFYMLKNMKHLIPPIIANWQDYKSRHRLFIPLPSVLFLLTDYHLIFLLLFLRNGAQGGRLRGGSTTRTWTLK